MQSDAIDLAGRDNHRLAILSQIAQTLNRATELDVALHATLAALVELLGLQTGWLFLRDADGKLQVAAHHNLPPALALPGKPWCGGCNCHTLFKSGELNHAINVVHCSRLAEATGDRRGLEFHASAPLRSEEQMLGVLNVAGAGSEQFTPDVLLLLAAVGAQLGTAIERIKLAQRAVDLAALQERNRLARDIHDTLAQGLAAITLHLEAAQSLAETRPDAVGTQIDRALHLARTNLDEARRSVLGLRAGPLEGRTLPEALRDLIDQFTPETGLAADVQLDPSIIRLPAALETALFRIAQEALNNVRKHAHARRVTLRLSRSDQMLRLQVTDDGIGFDPANVQPTTTGGFGVLGMSERAKLIGGQLVIESAPGAGTRVAVTVEGAL